MVGLPRQRLVGVAQLAERWLVEPEVAGSSPVAHPTRKRLDFGRAVSRLTQIQVRQAEGMTSTLETTRPDEAILLDQPWSAVVWDDPVNLMSYVTWVFRDYFGFDKAEAARLMLLVHTEGRAVVATGSREEMERHVVAMHGYGLWASLQKADA
jgi:ATP-dependent Clp protease adaptor protein ClpS